MLGVGKLKLNPTGHCSGFLLPVEETILKQRMNVFAFLLRYVFTQNLSKKDWVNSCPLAFSHTLMGHPSLTSPLPFYRWVFLLFVFVSLSEFFHECDAWKISRTTFDLRKTRNAKHSHQELIVADLLLQIFLTRYPLLYLTPVIISWNKFNNAYIFTRSLSDRGNNGRVRDGLYCKANPFTVS